MPGTGNGCRRQIATDATAAEYTPAPVQAKTRLQPEWQSCFDQSSRGLGHCDGAENRLSILFAEQPGPGATMGSRWHNAGRLKERKPDSKKRQPEWTEGQLDSASGTEDARRDEVFAELWFVI